VRKNSRQYPVPTYIPGLRPIQMANPNVLGILAKGRSAFTTNEWRDFLVRSIGLEPTALDERAKMVVLLRMAPLVERNFNLVELGPRGTGNNHLFQQL
jgi:ATP-dependent Lon protease